MEQYIILQNFSLFTVLYILFFVSKFYLLKQNHILYASDTENTTQAWASNEGSEGEWLDYWS